jgi:hypothetical protein
LLLVTLRIQSIYVMWLLSTCSMLKYFSVNFEAKLLERLVLVTERVTERILKIDTI